MQPLNYLQTTGGIIWTAACILLGFALTWLAFYIINKIPAAWLCDYNEAPSEELLSGKRVNYAGAGIVTSVIAAASLVLCRLQFNKGFDIYFICFALIIMITLMIAVCDIKYTIIPDQFTVAVAVLGLLISIYDLIRGFGLLHTAWWSPLAGAALGAGVMIFIDVIGMIVYKKDGMGFGDVKLFAAIGLLTGFPGTIYAFLISLITALIGFGIIIAVMKIIVNRQEQSKEQGCIDNNVQAPEQENSGCIQEEFDDDKNGEAQNQPKNDEEDYRSGGSYLAFGPYIAISLICYIVFYDFIHYIVNFYLSLF